MRPRLIGLALALAAAGLLPTACLREPPQIVGIYPNRGSANVHSNAPVRLVFDRPVDEASVASRFELLALGPHPLLEIPPRQCPQPGAPRTAGRVEWASSRELVFTHATLLPNTEYQAVLLGGYRDQSGTVDGLCHYWTFVTETAPLITSVSPGDGGTGVDPSTYLNLAFTHPMDLLALERAMSFTPTLHFSLKAGSAPGTVLVAPQELLRPSTRYRLTISRAATDQDGNRLARSLTSSFATGPFQPLHGWVTFIGMTNPAAVGVGVWIVDAQGFPRQIAGGSVQAFSWSPDGRQLLVEDGSGNWSVQAFAGPPTRLPFHAGWARSLGPGQGYLYLDGGTLTRLDPDGSLATIATGVTQLAMDPAARRVAFAQPAATGTELVGYDVSLRARYVLASVPGQLEGLAWSPDDTKLAWLTPAAGSGQQALRVLDVGSGTTATVATGDLAEPVWEADSVHIVVLAEVAGAVGLVTKVLVLNSTAPASLNPSSALPAGSVQVEAAAPSPDGRQIAFLALDTHSYTEVWLMNSDGSGVSEVTAYSPVLFPYSCRAPAWSPT